MEFLDSIKGRIGLGGSNGELSDGVSGDGIDSEGEDSVDGGNNGDSGGVEIESVDDRGDIGGDGYMLYSPVSGSAVEKVIEDPSQHRVVELLNNVEVYIDENEEEFVDFLVDRSMGSDVVSICLVDGQEVFCVFPDREYRDIAEDLGMAETEWRLIKEIYREYAKEKGLYGYFDCANIFCVRLDEHNIERIKDNDNIEIGYNDIEDVFKNEL